MALSAAHADTLCINRQEEAATGTYRYPVDSKGQYTPGYFYVPAEADVTFTLSAQDGATLHVFDDAAGTHELPVPAGLRTAGQSQSNDNGSSFHEGDVHLTQGWHMLYVEYTLLALRDITHDCYCRLWFSSGQLHDRVEAVSSEVALDDWVGTTTRTRTGTITVTKADGETLAAGDNLTYAIDKITTDPEGQNPVDASSASISGDAATDANGVANVTITLDNVSPNPCIIWHSLYIFLRVVDTSQPYMATPQPVTAQPSPQPTTNNSPRQANQANTAVTPNASPVTPITNPVLPILPIVLPCDPGGSGGDPGGGGGPGGGGPPPDPPHPAKVLDIKLESHLVCPIPGVYDFYGHLDTYLLQVVDQYGKPWTKPVRATEKFTNVTFTTNTRIANALKAKGTPGKPGYVDTTDSFFDDNNNSSLKFDTGAKTFWFKLSQKWVGTTPTGGPYDMGTHTIKHYQDHTDRDPPPSTP